MYFAEILNGVVGSVGGGAVYTVLPPNSVELDSTDGIRSGMIYEDGAFREPTEKETNTPYLAAFRSERSKIFSETAWVRERHTDNVAMRIDDTVNYDLWLKYWQTLRDIHQQPDFDPKNITWGTKPK